MSIIESVKNTVIENQLIKRGERVLVALSGGSDSVAMLDILVRLSSDLGFLVCAAHINHNIREESKSDEDFVKKLCESYKIECFIKSADVLKYAKEKSISTELAGRKIRYEFFGELKEKHKISKIATAHNKNDSCESVLLHFFRGCGIDGLCGIPVLRDDCIIRPIIGITKEEVESYCKENSLRYVTDKTNFETDYTRNKIRLDVIPYIEKEINSGFLNTLSANTVIFKEISEYMHKVSEELFNKAYRDGKLDLKLLENEDNAIIRMVIQKLFCDFSKSEEKLGVRYVDEILKIIKDKQTSKTVNLPDMISARIEYNTLYFTKTVIENKGFSYDVEIGKELYIKEIDKYVLVKEEGVLGTNSREKLYFYIDNNKKLTIRSRKSADKLKPSKMNGTKKLSDLFCDLKIPVSQRDKIPILVADDEIIWVMGIRSDRRFEEGRQLMSAEFFKRRKD